MLKGQTELTDCFCVCNTFLVFGTHAGTGQTLEPQGLQEKRANRVVCRIKNNFRKNCRLLTNSPKNLNTMLSLCYLYNIYIYAAHYVVTIPL